MENKYKYEFQRTPRRLRTMSRAQPQNVLIFQEEGFDGK